MLLQFSIQNFRSIRDKQTLSLAATRIDGSSGVIPLANWGHGVLRVAAVYGANASGKTNVLRGLSFVQFAVLKSQSGWKPDQGVPRQPFQLDTISASDPSTFIVEFALDGTQFEYGFSVDSLRVLEEWLYAYPKTRRQIWFHRTIDKYVFGKNLTGKNRVIENVTRSNSLFLSAAAQNNHEQLTPIYGWFSTQLSFQTESRFVSSHTLTMCAEEKYGQRIKQMLQFADLGVVGVDVSEKPHEAKTQRLMEVIKSAVSRELEDAPPMIFPEKETQVTFRHRCEHGGDVPMELEQESQGTRAFLSLLGPVIAALEGGRVLCIDELDSSLHPLLALEIVRAFNDPALNPNNAQLIFNTHDTNLLDPDVIRRDQVWFVEKDKCGVSHLYPLSDFKPRKYENLQRGYLQGRYGAVPFIGLQRWLDTGTQGDE
jgi:uncharacterized protein